MTDRTYDLNAWVETYKETFTSFAKAQQDGFKALERFARFHYAVAGDVLETGLATSVRLMKDRLRLLASLYAQSRENPKTSRFVKAEIAALNREIAAIQRLVPGDRSKARS